MAKWKWVSRTVPLIFVWFWEAYQNYNQQKETEQIFLDASKKIDEIEKNLDNNEDTNKQFSEIKKTLTWRILNWYFYLLRPQLEVAKEDIELV